jgi:hypothetical protein
MQNFIANSSATYKAGIAASKRIFRVASGHHAGRIAVLMQTSASEICLSFSDYPYTAWSSPALMINDGADYVFDAFMSAAGHIYVAYTSATENNLVIRKLIFSDGNWSPGALNTIYDGDDNYFPSINVEPNGRIWASWSRFSSGQYYINVKFSDDDGVNWPSGSSSAGTTLSAGHSSAWSKIIIRDMYVYCVYSVGGAAIACRKKHFYNTLWDSEETLASGGGYDHDFDVAVSGDGKLGVVFDDGKIRFREFDGSSWGTLLDIDNDGGQFPQIKYVDNIPYLIYIAVFGSGQNKILYTRRESGYFSTPALLDRGKAPLSKVLLYRAATGDYIDRTSAAASEAVSDIYRADSAAMVKDVGDAIYLGLDAKFHYLKIILGTIGFGGGVNWQYFNGQEWATFVPPNGNYNFTAADKELLLWNDYNSVPSDWQKKTVCNSEKLWLRAVVCAPYSTAPIGSQITSISNLSAISIME